MMKKHEILKSIHEYALEELQPKQFIPGRTQIPVSFPSFSALDVACMGTVLLNFWYTEYKECIKFANALCELLDKKFAILTNSGSSASLIAITACNELFGENKPKARLILTCGTNFPTTVSPIYQNNLIPYYIDIDPLTFSPDLDQLEEIISKRREDIAGVVLAHTMGFPFDECRVRDVLGNDIWFVADCCDAFGAEVQYRKNKCNDFGTIAWVGEYADVQTHSFFPAHIITTIEGGAALTNNTMLSDIMRSLVNWGRSCYCLPGQSNTCGHRFDWEKRGKLPEKYDHKYIFDRLGYNLKMTEFQAALGFSQLIKAREFGIDRLNNFYSLRVGLAHLERYFIFTEIPEWSRPVPFGFPIIVRKSAPFTDEELINYLEEHKISTRRVFAGNITKQLGFMNLPYERTDLSGSDIIMNQCFWVGVHPSITEEMTNYMIETVNEFVRQYE